jgi:ATP-dependent helicase/nuclease subunit B
MAGQIFVSSAAAMRRARAVAFVSALPVNTEVLLVSATRGASDDLGRELARLHPATFGVHRFSLTQLAARLAATRLAARGLAPATGLGTQAVAARAVFEAGRDGALTYFAPVAEMPGFPSSLARTLTDLRMTPASSEALRRAGESGPDLARLYDGAALQFQAAGAADRAALFATAREALVSAHTFCHGSPIVLVDVPLDTAVEQEFVRVLLRQASDWIAVVPDGDERARDALGALDASITVEPENAQRAAGAHGLVRLRRYLFSSGEPAVGARDESVIFFSAPGEGREAVEIARYALDEARRGVRFDEMAVFLRSPREYLGLLEHAFARAAIPVWLGRGTRRPHPAGRALLALLSCADENLSAHRFAEYLSLAQVPGLEVEQVPEDSRGLAPTKIPPVPVPEKVRRQAPANNRAVTRPEIQPSLFDTEPIRPRDDALATGAERLAIGDLEPAEPDEAEAEDPRAGVLQGTVRAPYKWEQWLIESAVIAGRDRWKRLDGLASEYRLKLKEAQREDPGSSRTQAIERDVSHLENLRAPRYPPAPHRAACARGVASYGCDRAGPAP